jgi:hypothetical protein
MRVTPVTEIAMEKLCRYCNTKKLVEDFGWDKGRARKSRCRPCENARAKQWRDKNRDHVRKYDNAYYNANSARERITRVARAYKVTREEAVRLDSTTNCEICSKLLTTGQRAIDHCHATGAVRGVLCHRCNLTLGKLGDSADLARRMADYLDHRRGA